MAKRQPASSPALPFATTAYRRKHATLILCTYLTEEANKSPFTPGELTNASTILHAWATAAKDGHLKRKETELDSDFQQKIFGEALRAALARAEFVHGVVSAPGSAGR